MNYTKAKKIILTTAIYLSCINSVLNNDQVTPILASLLTENV